MDATRHLSAAAASALALMLCAAETAEAEPHHLLRPVPRERMRPLSADRPDLTESPYTVDAGHLQVEMDAYRYTRDDAGPLRRESSAAGAAVVKMGLLRNLDLQLGFESWMRERVTGSGAETTISGRGDTALRLKLNLWGQGPGQDRAALALLPFFVFPTAVDDLGVGETVYGLSIPASLSVGDGTSAAFMVQGARAGDETEWLFTAVLGRTLHGALGGFAELAASRAPGGGAWASLFNTGMTYGVGPDLQLDAGAAFGLDDEADDVTVFAGLTARR